MKTTVTLLLAFLIPLNSLAQDREWPRLKIGIQWRLQQYETYISGKEINRKTSSPSNSTASLNGKLAIERDAKHDGCLYTFMDSFVALAEKHKESLEISISDLDSLFNSNDPITFQIS